MSTPYRLLLLLCICFSVKGQNYYTTPKLFPTYPVNWNGFVGNGNLTEGVGGLTSSTSGSLIWSGASPDGTPEYEVRANLRYPQTGGSYWVYARATQNALAGASAGMPVQGTFYALEINCGSSPYAVLWKVVNGVTTALGSAGTTCHTDLAVRFVVRNSFLQVFQDSYPLLSSSDPATSGAITGGFPGIGVNQTHANSGFSSVQFFAADRISPQVPVVSSTAFDWRYDLQWQPPSDDPGGSGVHHVEIYRRASSSGPWELKGTRWAWETMFSDTTVQPSSNYEYLLRAVDYQQNFTDLIVSARTAAAGFRDARRIGVQALGGYWGAAGEQIDVQSGNLNFTLPLVLAKSRAGLGMGFALNFNNQNWRVDSGGTWRLGFDIGYGFGWRVMAGSISPIYSDSYTIDHYVYTDNTGAEYRLNVNLNNANVWTSTEGTYVSYDANTHKLWFNDGTFWQMDAESGGIEEDAGARYPTLLQDSNGNQIVIHYQTGRSATIPNSSARITEIIDPRAYGAYGQYVAPTYQFHYTSEALPHLQDIIRIGGGGRMALFTYQTNIPIVSPINGATNGSTTMLASVQRYSDDAAYAFTYANTELARVTMPYGGYLEWSYQNFTYTGGITQREVSYRRLGQPNSPAVTTHAFAHDPADSGRSYHSFTSTWDDAVAYNKVWVFSSQIRLTDYLERKLAGGVATPLTTKHFTWTQNANENPYISQVDSTLLTNGNSVSKRSLQTLDAYGNVTWSKQYDYGLSEATARTYTHTYVTSPNYIARYIRNRLLTSTLTSGSNTVTLVTNAYDTGAPCTGMVGLPYATPPGLWVDVGTQYRGNLSTQSVPGNSTCRAYDSGGMVRVMSDNSGTVSVTTDYSRQYSVPTAITANGYQTSFTWDTLLQPASQTGTNGESVSMTWDNAERPQSQTSPYGATTTYTYSQLNRIEKAITGTHWVKTYTDGFGRPVKIETGSGVAPNPEVVETIVEKEYAPCACTPLGKLKRVSQPYKPGQTPVWTVYTYDEIGRTLTVTYPPNTGTTGNSGYTEYVYDRNQVTVYDARRRWKTYTSDGFGNLVQVDEPRPGGGTYTTNYQYNFLDKLTQVTMVRDGITQTRTFQYDANWRLWKTTFPENGTTTYNYNADGTLASKVDAKGQTLTYAYDSKKRPISVTGSGINNTFSYDTNAIDSSFSQYAAGRLTVVQYPCAQGNCTEQYSYNPAGGITVKKLEVKRGVFPTRVWTAQASFVYDNEGRVVSTTYPSGQVYLTQFDALGRPSGMTSVFRNTETEKDVTMQVVQNVTYNAAGQMLTRKVLAGLDWLNGASYATENWTYNNRLQTTAYTEQTNYGNVLTGHAYSYGYSDTQNDGKTVSMTRSGETVTYQYDELQRLTSATAPGWSQSFTYDGFGNLYKKVGTGTAAGWSADYTSTLNSAKNQVGTGYDANGNMGTGYDAVNRLTSYSIPTSPYLTYTMSYAPDNKRIYRKATPWNGAYTEEKIFFYVGDRRMATCGIFENSEAPYAAIGCTDEVWFAGRPLERLDRLGSKTTANLLPYGEEITSPPTANNGTKFATYWRDEGGFDYADQRHYSPGMGRFLTADPYLASGGVADPSSWNRYAYVKNDPINFIDSKGLNQEFPPLEAELGGGGFDPSITVLTGTGSEGPYNVWYFADAPGTGGGSGGGGGGGGSRQLTDAEVCDRGLRTGDKNRAGVERAKAAQQALQQAAARHGVDWRMLAAIGVRETNFLDINQSDGYGVGVFQIDLKAHPKVTAAQAHDFAFAADFAAALLQTSYAAFWQLDLDGSMLEDAIAIRGYNTGPNNKYTSSKIPGGVPALDRGTAGNNYVSNVLDLMKCF